MNVVYLTGKQRKQFLKFRRKLYKGDENYVSTSEFVLEDILFQKTAFTQSCFVVPVLIEDNCFFVAGAIFVYHKNLPYLQIAFFEALENQQLAVDLLLSEAQKQAKKWGLSKIVIGLNGHISYGVGILTRGFDFKNSFDSLYNKSYYKDYFQGYSTQTLSTYYHEKAPSEVALIQPRKGIKIRYANMKNFKAEMELMWGLCEQTISKTFLYFPTQKEHFYELIKDLKPFLKDENLLFAEDDRGNTVGFMFWHPDYNKVLKGGCNNSILKIALAYFLKKSKIDTVKINAMGALSPYATTALLHKFSDITGRRYRFVETNFVWDNNIRSSRLNERFFGPPHRKYEVYFLDEVD